MNNKTKLIIAGSIFFVLLLLVIYLNWPSSTPPPVVTPEADKAIEAQIEQNNRNPAPMPDMSKIPEAVRSPGGKAASPH